MGLFKKTAPADAAAKQWDRMIATGAKEATKQGVDVAGSLAYAHGLQDGVAPSLLVVWPDRVELHSRGRAASLMGQGRGAQSIPVGNISSVESAVAGVFAELRVHGSGHSLSVRVGVNDAPVLRRVILEAMQAA